MGSWVVEMQAKLDSLGDGRSQEEQEEQLGPGKPSIYKVPPHIRKNRETSFQPQLVSFGPYHHGAPHLRSMEAHKEGALLCRLGLSRRRVQEVFDLVTGLAQQLKASYDSLDSFWQGCNEEFVRLMVLDGCFLLELLQQRFYFDTFRQPMLLKVWHLIRADILMLENQLPMSLLLSLDGFLDHKEPDIKGLNSCIFMCLTRTKYERTSLGEYLHVLDLYRKHLLYRDGDPERFLRRDNKHENENATTSSIPNSFSFTASISSMSQYQGDNISLSVSQSQDQGERTEVSSLSQYVSEDGIKGDNISFSVSQRKAIARFAKSKRKGLRGITFKGGVMVRRNFTVQGISESAAQQETVGHNVVRPATELHEAGVRFKKSEQKGLQDITFKGGVLELPNFAVGDSTESIFLNLIAFEHCHQPLTCDITSFVCFMDRIIDDGPDIQLLSSKGIINNSIGTDKEAADLINKMTRGLVFRMNDHLLKVYENLINYSNKRWHKWRANLIHTYFRSPWAIISVIAAFILLSLTVVQTIFTILN